MKYDQQHRVTKKLLRFERKILRTIYRHETMIRNPDKGK